MSVNILILGLLMLNSLYQCQTVFCKIRVCIAEQKQQQMRISDLYRIEKDYSGHKKRLQSIQNLSVKDKVSKQTSQHFYVVSQYRKKQKEQLTRRQHYKQLMQKTITERSKRIREQYYLSPITGVRQINQGSVVKGLGNGVIDQENMKLRRKINNIKSVYSSLRKRSVVSLGVTHNQSTKRMEDIGKILQQN